MPDNYDKMKKGIERYKSKGKVVSHDDLTTLTESFIAIVEMATRDSVNFKADIVAQCNNALQILDSIKG